MAWRTQITPQRCDYWVWDLFPSDTHVCAHTLTHKRHTRPLSNGLKPLETWPSTPFLEKVKEITVWNKISLRGRGTRGTWWGAWPLNVRLPVCVVVMHMISLPLNFFRWVFPQPLRNPVIFWLLAVLCMRKWNDLWSTMSNLKNTESCSVRSSLMSAGGNV